MVLFNYSTKEITAKIVYYGPGLCGKTTNLQFVYENLPQSINKGKMLSLATKTDRTLFFDFLPIDLGTIRGMRTRLQLYTVPGQVFYNTTRKLVLKGADGVVFVADSQRRMIEANVESFKNLEENLAEHDMNLAEMPMIVQFNKRDLPDVAGIEELNAAINKFNAPIYEAVATTGIGVHETLKAITRLVLNALKERYVEKSASRPASAAAAAAAAAAASAAAPAAERSAPPAMSQPAPARPAPPAQPPARIPAAAVTPAHATIGRAEVFEEEGTDLVDLDQLEEIAPEAPSAALHASGIAETSTDDALELDLDDAGAGDLLEEPILEIDAEPEMDLAPPEAAAHAPSVSDELLDLGNDDEIHVIDAETDESTSDPLGGNLDLDLEITKAAPSPGQPAPDPLFSDSLDTDDLIEPAPQPRPSQAPPPAHSAPPAPQPAPVWSAPDTPSSTLDAAYEIDADTIEPMAPVRVEPPRPAHMTPAAVAPAAIPGGLQEIALPVRLEIAGQMIQLELKISLDLIGRAARAAVTQSGREPI